MSKGGNPNVYLSTIISTESEFFFHSQVLIKSPFDYSLKVRVLDNADNGSKQESGSHSHLSTSLYPHHSFKTA